MSGKVLTNVVDILDPNGFSLLSGGAPSSPVVNLNLQGNMIENVADITSLDGSSLTASPFYKIDNITTISNDPTRAQLITMANEFIVLRANILCVNSGAPGGPQTATIWLEASIKRILPNSVQITILKKRTMYDSDMEQTDVYLAAVGSNAQLMLLGMAGATIKWSGYTNINRIAY